MYLDLLFPHTKSTHDRDSIWNLLTLLIFPFKCEHDRAHTLPVAKKSGVKNFFLMHKTEVVYEKTLVLC